MPNKIIEQGKDTRLNDARRIDEIIARHSRMDNYIAHRYYAATTGKMKSIFHNARLLNDQRLFDDSKKAKDNGEKKD